MFSSVFSSFIYVNYFHLYIRDSNIIKKDQIIESISAIIALNISIYKQNLRHIEILSEGER